MSNFNPTEQLAITLAAESWSTLTDKELAAAYMSATFTIPPMVQPETIAFRPAFDMGLVNAIGRMHRLTFRGLELAVARRDL